MKSETWQHRSEEESQEYSWLQRKRLPEYLEVPESQGWASSQEVKGSGPQQGFPVVGSRHSEETLEVQSETSPRISRRHCTKM